MSQQLVVAPAFPALRALGLLPEHIAALVRQGSLRAEGPAKNVVKLQFRYQGRRIVRYVGIDVGLVARVREELEHLQHDVRVARSTRRLVKEARSCLRQTKTCLAPALADLGYHFRGHEIRRRRIDKQADCERTDPSSISRKGQMVMDDRNKPQIAPSLGSRSQLELRKPSVVKTRHQERVDELMSLALKSRDCRQALVRYGMAKAFGLGALVADRAEQFLQSSSLNMREFRKQVLPVITVSSNALKQGARLAQIYLEYDQLANRSDDDVPLLPGSEAED